MITQYFQREILKSLASDYFDQSDFQLTTETISSTSVSVFITNRYDSRFYFNIEVSNSKIGIEFNPGRILTKEMKIVKTVEDVQNELEDWLSNIENEMENTLTNRKLQEQGRKIEEIEGMLQGMLDCTEDSEFNPEELEELKKRMDELQNKLEEKIKEDIEKESEQKRIIQQLKKDFKSLKAQSNTLTKRNWILSLCVKMYLWGQKNPTLAKLAGTLGYSIIPESLVENIPEEYTNLLLPNVEKKE
ncbi:hypothetical protein [Shouchella clausii]|uniref:hypothetical protein n=1 Tax=Shouchella clausii TaxID=79880 RepID=UPI000795C163|nr:hypothetical protein [Shouchella clausii]KKI84485.1 hypothetical protein WZ76_20590 [Shouchella clausii]